jgi:hypothetical protein
MAHATQHATHDPYSEQTLVCIQNCQDCHRACLQTLVYCMGEGGPHAEADHLRLLMDCADICAVSAAFMLRASDLHGYTCAACAEVCRRCADDCAGMGDDLRMKALADTCRHCAESCAAMSAGAGGQSAATAPARAPRRSGDVMTRRKTR